MLLFGLVVVLQSKGNVGLLSGGEDGGGVWWWREWADRVWRVSCSYGQEGRFHSTSLLVVHLIFPLQRIKIYNSDLRVIKVGNVLLMNILWNGLLWTNDLFDLLGIAWQISGPSN